MKFTNNFLHRYFAGLLIAVGGIFAGLIFPFRTVSAQDRSFIYENINVDISVNEDSTMDVSEKITFRFDGSFREVYRQITLLDSRDIDYCKNNESAQCGGFEFILVKDVLDGNGNSLKGKYKESEVDNGYEKRHEVAWEFASGGKNFNNETFTWTIKYKVFGGLGYFDDYDLFYWNVLFEDRAEPVKSFTAEIKFPEDIAFSKENFSVFGSFSYDYEYDLKNTTLKLSTLDVPPYSDYTVLIKFPKNIIHEYARLDLELDPSSQDVTIEGVKLQGIEGRLYGLPGGKHELVFSKSGYVSKNVLVEIDPGEIKSISVELEPTFFTKVLKIAIIAVNGLACIFVPVFAYFMYAWWNRKGRDRGGRKTIVPWFEPPDQIPPYLLGSLKDERVDTVDITGTIIDLAYKGFIKIKEEGGRRVTGYEFTLLKDINQPGTTETEKVILTSIFAQGKKASTSDLKNKFYSKMPGIIDGIYDEMVARKYFDKRPDRVRTKYLVIGILMLFAGFAGLFVLPFLGLITPPMSLLAGALIVIFVSFFMPAKTPKGTEVYEQIKGFRMYLHTAERFRVQKLTPETFEKYLSYAIIFGIEKEWAKKFKDIYKKMPEWYESRSGRLDTFNAIYLANSLSSFRTSAGTTFTSSPSSGGSFGGGFSGGGGFGGGFGGGGGGGGGGGAR
ncbi:DUF2207 domain-containing protein [Candidatus Dojkabacteria bacterium]|nr:DUF2207 domain-containing protein [Candidatus Dojkabacteria bacterium]